MTISELPSGTLFNHRYRIEEQLETLAESGKYKAVDTRTNKPVILWLFTAPPAAEAQQQLLRSMNPMAALDHHNIAPLLSSGIDGDVFFTVEPYLDGQILTLYLSANPAPRPLPEAFAMILDITRALEYAHSREVVHGALTPEHLIVTAEGIRVGGLARSRWQAQRDGSTIPLDPHIDLQALGAIAYLLLTGVEPATPPTPPRELNPRLSQIQAHLLLKLLAPASEPHYTGAQQIRRIITSLYKGREDTRAQDTPLLVGRDRHLQALLKLWEQASSGRGQLLFITGEPGIGKTALAQQAAEQSAAPVVLSGRCQEAESGAPYQPFAQALRTYFTTTPPEFLDEEARQLCAQFARAVPEIRQLLPELAEPPALDPAMEQQRLMDSIVSFIQYASAKQPWFLILDDLQWIDAGSLDLLRTLGRRLPSMTLLVAGIYRDRQLKGGHPLLNTLSDLSRQPTYRHFPLEGLSESEVEGLLHNLWKQAVPSALVRKIHWHTKGNPFYVEQIAKNLVDEGLIAFQDGKWKFPNATNLQLPESIQEVVWRRIKQLIPEIRQLLQQATVLGERFSVAQLHAVSGLPMAQLLQQLDGALERQLIHEEIGDTLAFQNLEIRQALYSDLGLLEQRALHRQAGEALEQQAAPDPERIASELAYHYQQAGEFLRTVRYAFAAGRQAQTAYANETALWWYQRALDMLEQLNPAEHTDMQEMQIATYQALGEVYTLMGRASEALEALANARTLLAAAPATPARTRKLAALCNQTAHIYERRSEYAQALEWTANGIRYLDETVPSEELVQLHTVAGWALYRQGFDARARTQMEKALALAQQGALRHAEAAAHRGLGSVLWRQGEWGEAQHHAEQALLRYEEIGDRKGQGESRNNLGISCWQLGDYEGARAYFEQAIAIYQNIGYRWGQSATFNNLGLVLWQLGDYANALDRHERSWQIRREIGERLGETLSYNNIGLIYRDQGRYLEARSYYEQGLAIAREIHSRWSEAYSLTNLGTVYGDLGDYAQAETYLQQALEEWLQVGDQAYIAGARLRLSLLYHLQGDQARAQEYAEHGLTQSLQLGDLHQQALAQTLLGHALAGASQTEAAATAYKEALGVRRRLNQPHLAIEPQAGLARLALQGRNLPEARRTVDEILRYLDAHPVIGPEEPFRIYLTCYQVLTAAHDPRAAKLLDKARAQLQERAAAITDEALRASFLNNVAAHRELLAAD